MPKHELIASGIAGLAEVTLTHPLDFLKTKLQESSQSTRFLAKTPKQIFRQSIQQNGIKGLYSGFGVRLAGIVPIRLAYWAPMSLLNESQKLQRLGSFSKSLVVGSVVGTCQTLVDNPIEVIKTRRMTKLSETQIMTKQQPNPYRLPWYRLPTIGLTAAWPRNTIFCSGVSYAYLWKKPDDHLHNFFLCGTAGATAAFISQPLDYVKTNLQRHHQHNSSPWTEARKLLFKSPRSLFRGGMARSGMSFFNMGFGGLVFIHLLSLLEKIDPET